MAKEHCAWCDRTLTEQQIRKGRVCCSRSCSLKLAYSNPDLRKRQSNTLKALYENPELRKKVSSSVKAAFDKNNSRQKIADALRKCLNTTRRTKYDDTIRQWTIQDPKKKQCAIDNKLNWIAFYTYDDFNTWLIKLKGGIYGKKISI